MISHKWSPMKRLIWLRGSGITGGSGTYETISGNPVSFTAKAAPLRQLKVAFSPVQAGSGDPSPDNVRPISGWSEVTVEQTGVNLLDYSTQIDGYRLNASGELVSSTNNAVSDYIRVAPSTEYYFRSLIGSNAGYALAEYDETKALVKAQTFYGAGFVSKAVTTQATTAFVRVCFSKIHAIDPAVNYPATATEYVPYNPSSRSISISLGETVYSGTVDVVTGVGEVTHGIVDLGTLRWTDNGVGTFYTSSLNGRKKVGGDDCVCSALVKAAQNTSLVDMPNASFRTYANSAYIVIKLSGMTAENAQEMLSGFQLVYPLATPIPIQLTPQEVSSLLGDNVVWSTASGDVTVEYRSN